MFRFLLPLVSATLLVLCGSLAPAEPAHAAGQEPALQLAVVDIDAIGHRKLSDLKHHPAITWWVELDDQLLVATAARRSLARAADDDSLKITWRGNLGPLHFLRTAHRPAVEPWSASQPSDLVAEGGGYRIIRGEYADALALEPLHRDGRSCGNHRGIWPFSPNRVLARQAANDSPRPRRLFASSVQGLVDAIDEDRWFADIESLASYNRYSRTSDIANARDWLVTQFQALPGLSVTTESFDVSESTVENVIATLPGTMRPNDWYLVGAHYDSISENPFVAAPGAEDNASGCAAVLEMARIFTQNPPEGTVFFICYSGEEQGLFGSIDHAGNLVSSGDDSKVQGVLIMDMIGYTADADLDCLLEANVASQGLIDTFADAAATYTTLRIVTSLSPFGSDHVPYLNRGMQALLTIENDWDIYPGYHRTTDLAANISLAMGREVLKMNVAGLAGLAGAPAGLLFRDGFETGDLTAWSANSGG